MTADNTGCYIIITLDEYEVNIYIGHGDLLKLGVKC